MGRWARLQFVVLLVVAACGGASPDTQLRCQSDSGSFAVPAGWAVNQQPPCDTFPSCHRVRWGTSGLFQWTPAPEVEDIIMLIPTFNMNETLARVVASSGSDAKLVRLTATDVLLDHTTPGLTLRIVRPSRGTTRDANLIVLRTSYRIPDGQSGAGQLVEGIIIGFDGRSGLTTLFPVTHEQRPSHAEISRALDTIAATYIPGPAFGTL
jgi:hypothetical protein